MRTLFILSLVVCLGVVMLPNQGVAQLSKMSDEELREVTGQAGISITAEDMIDLNMEIGTVYYGDEDGTDGTPAYLSLNDISIKGTAKFDSPVTVNLSTKVDPSTNTALTGIDIAVKGVTIDMDHFTIGSITVGSAPGQGKSFGSFGIYDYHAEISGNIRITTH
jgi:hypothetical protein